MSDAGFIGANALWSDDTRREAAEVLARIRSEGIEVVRFGFPDQHGIVRGKALLASEVETAFSEGVSMTSSLFLKDTSHRTVMPIFSPHGETRLNGFVGAADFVMVPDPTTFRILPWLDRTGWILCDAHFADGCPVPYATRALLRKEVDRLRTRGMRFMAGLEVEFHLFELEDPRLGIGDSGQPAEPPVVRLTHGGYNYLTEQRYDRIEPILDVIRRHAQALGFRLRSMELEYGPSQIEFTFAPGLGLAVADDMILFRNAVKQIARREGYHATFMCRPQMPNVCSSGWHLHQSLRSVDGDANLFSPDEEGEPLSLLGRRYLAGLLRDAAAATPFSTPTVNGYKRYRPMSLAPDRAIWGVDNRGVMLRVIGGNGDGRAARIENRVGEAAANPYLFLASQIASGVAGIDDGLSPPPPADTPYETTATSLPTRLSDALRLLDNSARLRNAIGDLFVDYLLTLKRAELARYEAEVTAWEQREYFDLF